MGQSMNGWIKLHRKIWSNPIVTKDAEHLAAWIWLLTNATHYPVDKLWQGERITLSPGQLITGRKAIAKETGINEHKIDRILTLFVGEQQIERQTSSQGSLITILSWDKYQISEQQSEQQLSNNRATIEQQMSTKTSNKMSIVDNSPKQVKSKGVGGQKNKSEQQSEQQQIVYDFENSKKVSTIQEEQEYKNKRNQERYISPLVGQYIEYRERKKKSGIISHPVRYSQDIIADRIEFLSWNKESEGIDESI